MRRREAAKPDDKVCDRNILAKQSPRGCHRPNPTEGSSVLPAASDPLRPTGLPPINRKSSKTGSARRLRTPLDHPQSSRDAQHHFKTVCGSMAHFSHVARRPGMCTMRCCRQTSRNRALRHGDRRGRGGRADKRTRRVDPRRARVGFSRQTRSTAALPA